MNRTDNLKEVSERLQEALKLVILSIEKGALSNIDRDLILEKLRKTYDSILFEEENEKIVVSTPPTIHQVKVEKTPEIPAKPNKPEVKPQGKHEFKSNQTKEAIETSKSFEKTSIFEKSKAPDSTEKIVTKEPEHTDHKAKEKSILKVEQPESIAEKFQGKRKSMTDSLSNQINVKPIASQLQDKPIADLTKEIGVHDRFLFIKELFDGDSNNYEKTINKLNQFNDISEALIYLQENFNWNDNNKAANRFIDLIRRKLLND